MKKIVIINGSGGCGKDSFVEFCSEIVKVENIDSVAKQKEAAMILGWQGEKTNIARDFLAEITDASDKYNDYRYKCIQKNIDEFLKSDSELMFIHIRQIDLLERIKNDFNTKTLLILNSNKQKVESNHADANVEYYNYDYIINNDGTLLDLQNMAFDFIESIRVEYRNGIFQIREEI